MPFGTRPRTRTWKSDWQVCGIDVIASAEDADLLLTQSAKESGWGRIKATAYCLELAENLEKNGKKKESRAIYLNIKKTRTQEHEDYLRESADRAFPSEITSAQMKVPLTEAKFTLILALLFASSGYAKKKDFVSLFNGKDLEQWILPKGEHAWKIIDGVIDYESKGGNLTTQKSFSDYASSWTGGSRERQARITTRKSSIKTGTKRLTPTESQ